ncbi:acyl-CoA thioesterase [Parasphingorhabdus pacifica]
MDPRTQKFRLSYGDCDTVGLAYFAIYYPWMERTYSSWLFDNGIRAGELTAEFGVVVVGVHSEATYVRPARVFDDLACELALDRLGSSSYTLGFEFRRDDELITFGKMTFACRTPELEKSPIPPRIRELLESLPATPTTAPPAAG